MKALRLKGQAWLISDRRAFEWPRTGVPLKPAFMEAAFTSVELDVDAARVQRTWSSAIVNPEVQGSELGSGTQLWARVSLV